MKAILAPSLALSCIVGCGRSASFKARQLCGAIYCPADSTCDFVTATCIATGDPCSAGQRIACDFAADGCEGGCRWCWYGNWGACEVASGADCSPGSKRCDGNGALVVCDDDGPIDSISLERGPHLLSCTATTNNGAGANTETVGYDGMAFTTDLSWIPDPANGPVACGDSDESFMNGGCGLNWGPPLLPTGSTAGLCTISEPLPDQTPCGTGTDACCAGVCVPEFTAAVCP